MAGTWAVDKAQADQCYFSLEADANFQAFAPKLTFADPTEAQLTDESLPNDDEIAAISAFRQNVQGCRDLMGRAYQTHHPALSVAWDIRNAQADLVYGILLARRINYGNANALFDASYDAFVARTEDYAKLGSDRERKAFAEKLAAVLAQVRNGAAPVGTGKLRCRWADDVLACN